MGVTKVEPDLVEIEGFPGGWLPDPEPADVPLGGLIEASNLLPDRQTGAAQSRPGIKRFGTFVLDGYTARSVHPYNSIYGAAPAGTTTAHQYLIVCVADGTATANNVRLYAINTDDGTFQRIDDAGRQWLRVNAGNGHFGATIDNTYYGGSELDPIYSWRPFFRNGATNPKAWDPDATMPMFSSVTWTDAAVYALGDRVKDGTWVWICVEAHTATDAKRPKDGYNSDDYWQRLNPFKAEWASGDVAYKAGDIVTYKVLDVAKFPKYPRSYLASNAHSSFIAKRDHTSGVGKEPTVAFWLWAPSRGPRSRVALYHGSRLHTRDGDAGTSRWRYSGQVRADGAFDPTDWVSDDVQGPGFIDIRTGDGDDIKHAEELGNSLVIFKKNSTHVLAGLNPSTWAIRQISQLGVVGSKAACAHEDIAYFFSHEGLMMTDGTIPIEAPGSENIRDYLRSTLTYAPEEDGVRLARVNVWSARGFVWVSMPTAAGGGVTLAYDPTSQTWWPQDFATFGVAKAQQSNVEQVFMVKAKSPALVLQYDHPDAANADDTGEVAAATAPVAWNARTGWLGFGVAREDRVIRRVWAMVRGITAFTFKAYTDYKDTPVVWSVTGTPIVDVSWLEGRVIRSATAVSFRLSGVAPASVLGLGVQTQFRRKRYHRTTTTTGG